MSFFCIKKEEGKFSRKDQRMMPAHDLTTTITSTQMKIIYRQDEKNLSDLSSECVAFSIRVPLEEIRRC